MALIKWVPIAVVRPQGKKSKCVVNNPTVTNGPRRLFIT